MISPHSGIVTNPHPSHKQHQGNNLSTTSIPVQSTMASPAQSSPVQPSPAQPRPGQTSPPSPPRGLTGAQFEVLEALPVDGVQCGHQSGGELHQGDDVMLVFGPVLLLARLKAGRRHVRAADCLNLLHGAVLWLEQQLRGTYRVVDE